MHDFQTESGVEVNVALNQIKTEPDEFSQDLLQSQSQTIETAENSNSIPEEKEPKDGEVAPASTPQSKAKKRAPRKKLRSRGLLSLGWLFSAIPMHAYPMAYVVIALKTLFGMDEQLENSEKSMKKFGELIYCMKQGEPLNYAWTKE